VRAAVAFHAAVLGALVGLAPVRSAAFGLEAAGVAGAAEDTSAPAAAAQSSAIERATGVCQDRVEEELHREQKIRLVLSDEAVVPGRYRGIENGRLLLWQSPDDDENGEMLSHNLESIQRVNYTTTGGIRPQWALAGAAVGFLGGALVYQLTQDGPNGCSELGCGFEWYEWGMRAGGIGALIGMALSPFLPTSHRIECVPKVRRSLLE